MRYTLALVNTERKHEKGGFALLGSYAASFDFLFSVSFYLSVPVTRCIKHSAVGLPSPSRR